MTIHKTSKAEITKNNDKKTKNKYNHKILETCLSGAFE